MSISSVLKSPSVSSETPQEYLSEDTKSDAKSLDFIKRKTKKLYYCIKDFDLKEFKALSRILTDKGSNISLITKPITGMNVLHCAARYGNDEIVKFLLEKGFRTDIPCSKVLTIHH